MRENNSSAKQEVIIYPQKDGNLNRKISRDEMNLAEFPLTVLSTRSNPGVKTLEFSDIVRGKNGEQINRRWIITGADKFGLPTASDDEVLLGLLKLTVDAGMSERKVFFTRYEILKILQWTTEGRSYQRLQKALDRLTGVRIKATNAFYDNESKTHTTRNFGVIDAYEINDGKEGKPSFFIWSEALFKSFSSGFIKKLDFDLYLALESAVSKRIYRFLDKHFWYRSKVTYNLLVFAHEKIGISRNYRYPSLIRQQIDPALEELQAKNFILGFDYQGKGDRTEITIVAADSCRKKNVRLGFSGGGGSSNEYQSAKDLASNVPPTAGKSLAQREVIADAESILGVPVVERDQSGVNERRVSLADFRSESGAHYQESDYLIREQLEIALAQRGIRSDQAKKLITNALSHQLEKIRKIINYFDHLISKKSVLISRSPAGFLYRAVERPDSFILPGDRPTSAPNYLKARQREVNNQGFVYRYSGVLKERVFTRNGDRQGMVGGLSGVGAFHQPSLFTGATVTTPLRDRSKIGNSSVKQKQSQERASLESRYLVARRHEVVRIKQDIESDLLNRIRTEVESGIVKLKHILSPDRFSEAVEHGVEEKLLKLFAFPDFQEWSKRQSR
ncbi:MAG TPA: replication initiator protein A [Oligoflexia bacterium]|nr:replication initiator protein A [Oligoflexia bacterium]HMP27436.1 replication initiator protein A [Oligoflexia bacterium]